MFAAEQKGYILLMILSTLIGVLYPAEFSLFESTKSPSGRYAIAYRDANPGEPTAKDDDPTVNELVDLKANKVICVLKGFHGFPNENHGGMEIVYNKSESLAVLMRAGKWEPRGLAILAPSAGKYVNILASAQKSADVFVNPKRKIGYVWDVMGARCTDETVKLCMAGEVPKDANRVPVYVSLTYAVKRSPTTLALGKPKPAKLQKSQVWFWPMYK